MKKDKEAKKKKKEKSAQVSVPETVKTVSPETEDADFMKPYYSI